MILPVRSPARTRFAPVLYLAVLALCACSSEGDRKLPGVYRVDVQQGNVIEQEMIDKLRPGMDRNQVRFIMGTPAIADPFHANRWDYVFTQSKGGDTRVQRHVIVHFKDDKLSHVEGDVVPGVRKPPDELEARAASVDVPLDRNRPGVFSRMFNALPFVGDDNVRKKPRDADKDGPSDTGDASGTESGTTTSAEPRSAQPEVEQDLPNP